MFKRLKEKRDVAKAQREEEKREAEALRLLALADRAVYMTEIEESFRGGSIAMGEPSIILKKGEIGIMDLPASLWEGRAVRTGGYAGTRVRVAKGLSFNVGGFEAESHQELREIDSGVLTITNQRFVFSGSKRTLSIKLNKIITVAPYSDDESFPAISLSREGKQKTQYFFTSKALIPMSVDGREYEEPLNGQMIAWAIEGAIRAFV